MSTPNIHVKNDEPLGRIQGLIEQIADENRGSIDELKRQAAALTDEQRSLLAGLETQRQSLDTLKAWADAQDKAKPVGQKDYTPLDGSKPGSDPRRREFAMWLLDGMTYAMDGQARFGTESWKRTQTEGSTSGGGYLVHPEQQGMVTQLLESYGAARRLCRVFPMNKNEMRVPTLVTRPTVYWPDEGDAPAESAVAFGRPAITAKRLMAIDTLSIEVDEDSAPMLSDFIPDVFAIAIAKEEDRCAFVADAPTDPFDGLFFASGIQELVLGAGQTTYASITYDDLVDTMNKISAFALTPNAKWLMSTSLALALRKIKDAQERPLWQEMAMGNPNQLFGFDIVRSEVMPATSVVSQADTHFLLFGDFKFHAMGVRGNLSVDFSKEADFKKGNIVMRVFERVGFQPLIGTAMVRVKTHS